MVGGKQPQDQPGAAQPEPRPQARPRRLVRGAAAQAPARFRNRVGREVLDDHLPLNNAGIPTIDIIDFDYPYWHTADDLPENCSAASLAQVGRVVTAWLNQPPPRRRTR